MKYLFIFLCSLVVGFILTVFYFYKTPLHMAASNTIAPAKKAAKFSLEHAPTKSLVGSIASLSGTIFWQSRTASDPAQITHPQSIQQGEALVTGADGSITITIPAVASISATENTAMNFIQTLPAAVVIEQKQGQVTYDKIGNIPISVRTTTLLTKIQSGSSRLEVDTTHKIVTISVIQGSSIAAFNNGKNISEEVTIKQGYQYIYSIDAQQGKMKILY